MYNIVILYFRETDECNQYVSDSKALHGKIKIHISWNNKNKIMRSKANNIQYNILQNVAV